MYDANGNEQMFVQWIKEVQEGFRARNFAGFSIKDTITQSRCNPEKLYTDPRSLLDVTSFLGNQVGALVEENTALKKR